jgi:outer membrane receptor protein involved in Fe transport
MVHPFLVAHGLVAHSVVRVVWCLTSMLPMLLACATVARASSSALELRIIDKTTGKPVPHAEVSILGHPGDRSTDRDGRLLWQPAPPLPFEVLVILPGGRFMKPVLVERLPESGALDVAVELLMAETVTVAAGAAPDIDTTPVSATTLVTAADLLTRAPGNLVQALENVAGVSTVSEGQAAVPAVRGLAGGRTLILLDGVRITNERRAGPSATFLDPFSLESVEVARGPGSVAYGSDAFGGVIAARTRRVAPGSPLAVRATISGGAGVPQGRTAVEISRGVARGSFLAQTHVRTFSDYRSPEGDVFNSGARDVGVLFRAEHQAGPGVASLGWQSDFGRDIERPRNNARAVRFFYPTEDSHRLTGGYQIGRGAGFERISLTGFVGSYAVVTDQDRVATAASPRGIERADVSARDYQVRGVAERSLGAGYLEFGVDVNGRFGLHAIDQNVFYDSAGTLIRTDTNVSIDGAHRTDAALFASYQVPVGRRVLFAGGLRGDRIRTTNTGGFFGDLGTVNAATSGFGAMTVSAGRVSVTAQLARGFRDPVLSDRYYRGPTGRGFITGNPELDAETSLQLDGAVHYTAPRWRAAFYVFRYRLSDLVERYEQETDFFFFRNRGRARISGVEVEAQGEIGRGIAVELAGQVTRGRAPGDHTDLDGIPPASFSLQLRKPIAVRGFAQARLAAFARDARPGPTERVTPGYAVLDVSGGWRVSDPFELRVIGRNVLDQSYLLSADRRTVPAPGASILTSLLMHW